EALATIAKGRGDHVLLSAVDIAVTGTQNLAPGRPRLLDLGRGPLLLALPPVVVDGSSGLAQDDLLDPVTARPTGRCLALQRDAPRLATVGFDLVLEGHQLVPGLGHHIALRCEGFGVVPDQAFKGCPGVK